MRWTRILLSSLTLSVPLTGCASVFASHEKQFDLSSQPPDAEVYLDGNRLGSTPVKVKLSNHASHTFTFRKAGYKDATCNLVKTTGAGWVILDILGGILPVVVDAATNNWSQTQGKGCAGYLEALGPATPPSTAIPTQEVATARSATPLRDQVPGVTADTSHKALWKAGPGADPTAAAVVRGTEAIPFYFRSSAPDEIVYDATRSRRRAVVGDMLRLETIRAVEQGPLGILRTAVGPTFHTSNNRARLYSQLEQAYSTWKTPETPLVIELWEQGQKIGEYSDGVFNVGAGYTTPLDCSGPGPGGICGYGSAEPPPAVTATTPAPAATPTATTTVQPSMPSTAAPISGITSAATPSPASSEGRGHRGFHATLGLGAGQRDFTCDGCDVPSETAFSGYLSLAGSVGKNELLGVESTGWVSGEGSDNAQIYSLMGTLTGYLNARSGLFLTTGLGLVGYRDDFDNRATGFGYSGRLGYELVSGGVAIIPYVGFLSTIGGATFAEGFKLDINNLQVGLAVGIP